MLTDKIYLGDSVYAEFDKECERVILTNEIGCDGDPSSQLSLDHSACRALVKYLISLGIKKEK